MLGAELGVHEELDQVVLGGLLQRLDGETLKTDVCLVVVLHDLAHQLGEGQLADQQVRGLLVLLDLPDGNGALSGPTVRLHHALGRPGGLAHGLACDGLARRLGGGDAFSRGVLCSCHLDEEGVEFTKF